MEIIYADSSNFKDIISKDIVLVDFFATWCGPCKMLSPVLEELAKEKKDITIVKVDIDKSLNLAEEYSVMSVPTILLFKDGNVIGKTQGFQSKISLNSWLESLM